MVKCPAPAYNKANAGEKLVGHEKNDRFHIILDGNRYACHASVGQPAFGAATGRPVSDLGL